MVLPSYISQTLNVHGVFASTTMYPINNPNVGKSTDHTWCVYRYLLSTENKRIKIHMLWKDSKTGLKRPYLGKWSNLTNIFQMGWNHRLDDLPKLFYLHSRGEHESRGIGSVTCDAPIGSGKQFYQRVSTPPKELGWIRISNRWTSQKVLVHHFKSLFFQKHTHTHIPIQTMG